MSAPFDLYRDVFVHAIPVADQESAPRDVAFSNDGLKMFVVDSNQDKVHEYTLSTAFDVSTAIHVDFLSVVGRESTPKGMAFSNDGAKMFVVGSGSDNVNEYTLNSVYPITVTTTSATTPTLASIVRYDPVAANTGSQTLVYKATFSEDVTGVDASDFALSSGSTGGTGGGSSPVTNISGLGDVYHLTVFALQNGTYNLDLVSSGHGITDAATNPLTDTTPTTGTDQTYTVSIIPPDNTVPTLVSIHRSSPAVGNTDSQTLVYKVAFSEDVAGVNTSDFALSPDSIGGVGSTNIGGNSEQLAQTRSPALAIPDKITVSDTITVSNFGTAASVYVAVDITHAYIGDLKVDLIAPDGATRTLHNREGGSAGDLDRTYTLSFDDLLVAGTWTLRIHDGFNVYQGVLNNWTLTVNYGDPPTIPVTGISGSGDVYYVTVSALQDGTYNLDLVSSGHDIADAASNPLANTSPAGADETYTVSTTVVDNTNPRLESIERYNPASQNTDSSSLIYKATFNESVTGVDASDFVLSLVGGNAGTGSITGISGSGSQYSVTVSASSDGTYNLDLVQNHGIEDLADNLLTNTATTGVDQTYTVNTVPADSTAPTLTSIERYNPTAATTDSQTLVYEVTFSEAVTGVTQSDFVLSSDSTGGPDPNTGTGQFTQTKSPSAAITGDQDVIDTIAVSNSGNATSVSVDLNIAHSYIGDLKVDLVAPDGTTKTLHNRLGGSSDDIVATYTPNFNGTSISGTWTLKINDDYPSADDGVLNSWTLTINYGDTTNVPNPITSISGSGSQYSVTVSASSDGTYNLDLVQNHGIEDLADNLLTNTATTGVDQTYTVNTVPADSTAPTLTSIERYNPTAATTDSQTLVYEVTFSEEVTGVGTDDFVLSSDSTGAANSITSISGSGSQYSVTVSASSDGTYNLDLVQNHGIEDLADNLLTNTATTGVDQTYTVNTVPADSTAPTLTSIERYNPTAATTDSQTLVYEVTFSEEVTGVGTDDFVLSSDSTGAANSITSISGSGSQYSVTVSASSDGTYNLDLVQNHGIEDLADNLLTNTATTGVDQTYTVNTVPADSTAPTLTSIERYNPTAATTDSQTLVYEVTFSEAVTGVTQSDFVLSSDSTGGPDPNTGTGQFTQTKSPSAAITGDQDVIDTIAVSNSGNATSVSVDLNIAHSYIGDLKVDLVAPDGTTKTLHNRLGGSSDDIVATYTPNFNGTSISGTWTLKINDDYPSADDGVLNSWTLTINYGDTTNVPNPITSISGSGSQYSVTVSASTDGTYNLDLVQNHGIEDTAENPLTNIVPTTGTDHTYTVSTVPADNTAPTLASIQRNNPAAENTDSQTLVYEVTFSEDVTGVDTDDFVLSSDSTGSTTAADPVTSISGSGSVYYATVFASTDGTYNLDLVSLGHSIADAASNPLTNTTPTTGTDQTYTVSITVIDNTAPTLASIERYSPASQNTDSQTLVYMATFSENVTGVDASDFVLSPDSTWGGNTSASAGQFTQTRSPDLAIPDLTTVSDTVTVSDSETATSVSVAVDITHEYIGDLKIDLIAPDGTTTRTLHNRSGGSTDDIDQMYAPDFGGVSIAGTWTLQINDNYNADPGVLNSWTLTIDYGTALSPVTGVSGSGNTYYVTVPSSTDGTYNLDLISSGHNITDTAENPLTNTAPATGTDHTYTVSTVPADNTAPTLASIYRSSPATENTDSQTLVYEVTFSEDVTGVDTDDFVLSSDSTGSTTAADPVTSISGSGSVYYATVFASTDGTYNLDLVSSGHNIADAASNPLTNTTPTTGTDQTYTVSITVIDNTAPTLASIERYSPASQNTDSQTLVYMATFSENVTGVDASDFVLSPDSTWGGNTSASAGQFTQTRSPDLAIPDLTTVSDTVTVSDSETATSVSVAVDITHEYIGDLKIDLIAPDGTTTRTLHNRSGGSTDDIDQMYAPDFGGVSIAGTWTLQINDNYNADPGVLNSWTLTIDYGTALSPVTGVSGSGNTYYVTVPSSTDGTYNLDLVSSGHNITDTAENPLTNTAPATGTDHTYTVSTVPADNTAPTLASIYRSSPATENTDSQTLVYEVTFSEDVTGVDTGDFVLSSGSTGGTGGGSSPVTNISGSGSVYYATVSASTDGTYNLDLVSSGHNIADVATNPLTNISTTGADETYTVSTTVADNTNPRLESIERYSPASQNTDSQSLIYRATFSEDVTGVSASDFILSPDSTWGGNTSASAGQFMQTRSPDLAIPYDVIVSDTITVSDSGTATSISVTVDITHNYIGDLKIDLIAPDGTTTRTLHDREGGTTNNMDKTYAPLFGSVPISGVWTLQIHDNYDADSGVLNSWALTIDYGVTHSPVTEVSGSGNTYYVTVPSSTDGTYNLDLVSSGHGIADIANNPLTNTAPTTGTDQTYTVSTTVIDNTAPTLASLERSNPSTPNTNSQTLVYRVAFSESVTGVDTDDFVLSSDSTGGGSNNNNNNNAVSSEQFTQTRSPSSPITDNHDTSDTITVSNSGNVTSVSVTVNISHTYIGDLKVELVAPDGTIKTLHNREGDGTDDIIKTYTPDFDDDDAQIQGIWKLRINDNADGDTGTLDSWTLKVSYDTVTDTTISPVTNISGSGDVYYVTVSATQDGTYNLDLVSSGHGIADTASNPLTDTVPTGPDHTYTVSTAI